MASVDSFVFYRSFFDAVAYLPDEQRLKAYDAICDYALNHVETETDEPIINGMLALIKPQIDANYKRKLDGGKGGRPRTNAQSGKEPEDKASENHRLSDQETTGYASEKPNVNVNVNANENVNVNKKENTKERSSFVKPTMEYVRSYCLERNKGVDPEKWFNYYSANGWKVGKNPMKDWKAAVRTWEKNDTPTETPKRQSYEEQANAWRNF